QLQRLDITPHAQTGENVITVGLTVTGPTDGLRDLVKITGDFSLAGEQGAWRIVAPRKAVRPGSWTDQGYPFCSGRGVYATTFQLPEEAAGRRVLLEPAMTDGVSTGDVKG